MSKSKIEKILTLLKELPENTTPEDMDKIMYHIQLKKDVLEGIKQLDEGRGIPHDQVKKLSKIWLK
ncbi:MAG: hypothetical protein ACTSRI_20850 [Promethearchaeota archaeon]